MGWQFRCPQCIYSDAKGRGSVMLKLRFHFSPRYPSLHCYLAVVIQYSDVIISAIASQITGVPAVGSIVCSGIDQIILQSFASLASVRGIYRWPVVFPHKGPVTRKNFPFDDVIMAFTTVLFQIIQRYRSRWKNILEMFAISYCINCIVFFFF